MSQPSSPEAPVQGAGNGGGGWSTGRPFASRLERLSTGAAPAV